MSNEVELLSRESSLCSSNPYDDLLEALKNNNYEHFNKILEREVIDLDYLYDDPDYGTCLYIACGIKNARDFVEKLLDKGANPNVQHMVRKKAAIHNAAEASNYEALELLMSHSKCDVNLQTKTGDTALHLLAKNLSNKEGDVDRCIKILLNCPRIDVNLTNKKNYTALHLAASKGSKATLEYMLRNSSHIIDIEIFDGETAKKVLERRFPGILDVKIGVLLTDESSRNTIDVLFEHLFNSEVDKFMYKFTTAVVRDNEISKGYKGDYSFLQYTCERGYSKLVGFLLNSGCAPNYMAPSNDIPPVILACRNGYYKVLQEFLKHNVKSFGSGGNGETVLHSVTRHRNIEPQLMESGEEKSHRKCLDLLLDNLDHFNININAIDDKGNTPLHYAAKSDDSEVVRLLLEKGAYIGIRNSFGELPLANIDPETMEKFLDSCLSSNKEYPRDDNFELIFTYNFLAPPHTDTSLEHNSIRYTTISINDGTEDLKPGVSSSAPEIDPLLYISHSQDLRYLLKHPIFTSFLYLKWHNIKVFFYVNLIFYLMFVTLLSVYVLAGYDSDHPYLNGGSGARENGTQHNNGIDNKKMESKSGIILWSLLLIFLILLILREVFQLAVSPKKYILNLENYLEILLITVASLIIFRNEENMKVAQHLSAIAILSSWTELVLLIGRHPSLATNIEMLKRVSFNFLKFLAWYSILIVAFALSFYTLFRDCQGEQCNDDENFFLHPGTSILKTIVMLTGEFDASSIPFISFPITSHIVFVLFVFLIAIVLFNLLNGLAVSDTQAIKDDAELVGYVSRVKLIYYFESMLLGNPFSWLTKLFRCCCCLGPLVKCLIFKELFHQSVLTRVCLFPNMLPEKKAFVLPNPETRVFFESSTHRRKKEEEGYEAVACVCHTVKCGDGWSEITKAATLVLMKQGKLSDVEEIRRKVENMEILLEKYEKSMSTMEKKFDIIDKSLRELLTIVKQNQKK